MSKDKKQELLGIKLKNGIFVGEKVNKTTPSSSWKLGLHKSSSLDPNCSMNTSVSARKIGANLWEVQPQFNFNKNDADHDGDGDGLIHQRRRRHRNTEKEGVNPQPPAIETSLKRNIRELPSLRHLSVKTNSQDLQHASSASYCSSVQVTPYACAATLKTSTHLLKVVNRIWNLEQQHSFNTSLIKSLKRDLDISQAQIKTLVEERKRDHQQIDELKKSAHERKKKSTGDELLEIKASFLREKKARILLESLCDEFAKGIRDYEQKVRSLRQNGGKNNQIVSKNKPDRLILHVSEAWLDERAQMKCGFASISDNLCGEIETFLEAKKKQSHGFGGDILEKHEENISCPVGPGPTEPSAGSMAAQAPEAVEPLSRMRERFARQRGDGVKGNTLMAKLVEARLESQFSKSRTVRRT